MFCTNIQMTTESTPGRRPAFLLVLVICSSLVFRSSCAPSAPQKTAAETPLDVKNGNVTLDAPVLASACSAIAQQQGTGEGVFQGFSAVDLPDVDATTIAKVAVKYFADVTSLSDAPADAPSTEDQGAVDDAGPKDMDTEESSVGANAIDAPLKAEILACAPNVELAMKSVTVTEACRREDDASVEYIVEMDVVFTCTSSIATVPGQTYAVSMVSLVEIPDGDPLTVKKVFITNSR